MSGPKSKGPVVNSGICRCCGGTKRCRLLNHPYEFEGTKELYADMIMDCFGLLMSHLDGPMLEHLVCATCVVRLREAKNFKTQVLQCEEAFLAMKLYDSETKELDLTIVKTEACHTIDNDSIKASSPLPADSPGSPLKLENDDSNDDEPLLSLKTKKADNKANIKKVSLNKVKNIRPKISPLVQQKLQQRRRTLLFMKRKREIQEENLRLKLEDRDYDMEKSYKIYQNVATIVSNSYVCPFRCRHNHLLCYYCKKPFEDPEELRDHTNSHARNKFSITVYRTMVKIDIARIDCRLCDAKINDLEVFKEHIVKMHNKELNSDVPNFVLPFRLSKDVIQCCLCVKSFMYFHAANMHMNEHFNNYVCETCGLGFIDKSRLTAHKTKHESGSFPCEECGKDFKSEAYKDLHVDRVHKKVGKIYCPKCDIRLMTYPQKLKHLVEVHGEEPLRFQCTACDKVYPSRRYLTLHLRKYHIKDFRYECDYCSQKFFTGSALRSHLPTHTGERNFKCKVCEKSYPRSKTLKEHLRIHTNDRRYRCHICGQAFIQNCSLKGHMRSQHPEYG